MLIIPKYKSISDYRTHHVHGDIMPAPLTADIISMHTSYYLLQTHFNNMYNDFVALASALNTEGNPASAIAVNNINIHLWDIRNHLASGSNSIRYWHVKTMQWLDNNIPWGGGGGGIAMSDILTAMWASENWQTLLFIAYVDAMRGSVSEKTVTETNMGNYLRHFL